MIIIQRVSMISKNFIHLPTCKQYSYIIYYNTKGAVIPAPSLILRKKISGNVLLSQAVSHQVSSALRSLTSVFGMGTGVASPL